jgi:hypothetical protein
MSLCLFVSACGPGQAIGLILTPTSTLIPSHTETLTQTLTMTPTITSTFTQTPTSTVTPNPWKKYSVEYGFIVTTLEAWMPLPRDWDGIGMRNINITVMSPQPTNIYNGSDGIPISHWLFSARTQHEMKVEFEIELAPIDQRISDPNKILPYDKASDLYKQNTMPALAAQSDNPEIINLARTIVRDETNPYRQAYLIHQWVSKLHLKSGQTTNNCDALSAYKSRIGDCGCYANLFVALSRSLGIPARNISGLAFLEEGKYTNYPFGQHTWAEFYVQGYDWIQVDPTRPGFFAQIPDLRIILSRGSAIHTGRSKCGEVPWFHTPEDEEWCGGIGPNDPIWLSIKIIQS